MPELFLRALERSVELAVAGAVLFFLYSVIRDIRNIFSGGS